MTAAPMPPANTLASLVDGHSSMLPELPLVHTMVCEEFSAVTGGNELGTHHCDVFDEPLVYLFYGRPAFRSLKGKKSATAITHCPICFVFKPYTASVSMDRVYPFDTGACHGKKFEPHLTWGDVARYQLSATIESVRRYTEFFFETNRNYYLATARANPLGSPLSHEALTLHTFFASEGEAEFDDRRSTVEVQITKAIPLRDQLLEVILPTTFLESSTIRDTLIKDWRTYPWGYSTTRGASPSEYYGVIRERLYQVLSQGNYL